MSGAPLPKGPAGGTVDLRGQALENLDFIRDAMTRSSSFTSVSGYGTILMGVIACVGGWTATWRRDIDWWLNTWVAVGVVACLVGVLSMAIKARFQEGPVLSAPGRRFLLTFSPAIVAGCVLTQVMYDANQDHLLPAIWLLLYGVAVTNAGTFSVPAVPILGILFMVLGTVAALVPEAPLFESGQFLATDALMIFAFGGLHIVFGGIIAARYGG